MTLASKELFAMLFSLPHALHSRQALGCWGQLSTPAAVSPGFKIEDKEIKVLPTLPPTSSLN